MTPEDCTDGEMDARETGEEVNVAGGNDGPDQPTMSSAQECDPAGRGKLAGARSPIVVALAIVLAMGGLLGWLGFQARQSAQASQQRAVFIEAARQAALNLTTISYTEVDAYVKRIVDSATGSFHDDFQRRSPAFINVVKQAQAKSTGTVTAAGLESLAGNQAQVLVAVSVKTSSSVEPQEQPRAWRMRISVVKDRDSAKVSDVQFVP